MQINFIRFVAVDGIHFIRSDLISEVCEYNETMYVGFKDEAIDVKSKLIYDNGQVIYFKEAVDTIIKQFEELTKWEPK